MNEENTNNIEKTNEIIEITNPNEKTAVYDLKEIEEGSKNKRNKKSHAKKEHHPMSDKTKKIIIIVSIVVVLIIAVVLVFVLRKNKDSKKPNEPAIIVEKDNYRYENGTLVFLNKEKNEIGKYKCKIKDKDLCYIAKYSNEDEYDEPKFVYETGIKVNYPSKIYNNEYVFIYDNTGKENGLIILYDIKNQKDLGKYKLVKEVNDDIVILKDEEDKYGAKNLQDNTDIIPFEYDYLGFIKNKDNIVGIKDLNNYLLDLTGKEVTRNITGKIKNYNEKYISTVIGNEYLLVNYDGKDVLNDTFSYIKFQDDIILTVKNRKLYLYDNNLNKLNLEGKVIESQEYEDKTTLSDDYQELDFVEGLKLDITKDKIIVNKGTEKECIINKNEGKFSKNLKNMDYYEGILYIYDSETKTNLLGKYTCSNPNTITSNTVKLNNCYIAKETKLLNREKEAKNLGNLPIFNKRFVFIQDGEYIKLIDLKKNYKEEDKKDIPTYKAVDVGFYDNQKEVNYVNTANTLVMAKNKSDSPGMVRIEASKVNGVIAFKNNVNNTYIKNKELKFLKDGILTKREDGTYHLYDMQGNQITIVKNDKSNKPEELVIKNEIVDYNNVCYEVKTGDNLMLYTKGGKIITIKEKDEEDNLKPIDEKFVYIKLYDKFFVGITDKDEIGIYEYNGTKHKNPDGESKVILKSDFDKAYKITTYDNEITLDVYALDEEISYSFKVVL